jgi:alpha-beta hydrolase superfamily lysophospholipase
MSRLAPAAIIVGILSTVVPFAGEHSASREVRFQTSDGVTIYGDLYMSPESKSAPLILLFHQAGGDARGEYAPLVGRLLDRGYNLLAIDQRVGGSRFGGTNRTLAGLGDEDYSYCDALPDLEAALAWVGSEGFNGPRAAWGSSYSATLVLRLAAKHGDDLSAVLAFSPASGGPLAACRGEDVAGDITIPALIMRPASEMQRKATRKQMEIFKEHGFETYVADNGVHGSSMLAPSRVEGGVDETWNVVLGFLENIFGR